MKKNLIALVIVSVATLAGVNRANAQVASNRSSLEYENTIEINKTTQAVNSSNELEGVSPRALKNFAVAYKNVNGESWMKIKDGFSVRFISDGIRTTIYYDKKGNWAGRIKIYGEEKMLREIRHVVKSTYYDYNIVYTQEIETVDSGGVPTYLVCVDDKTQIKMIRICEGEMSVWKEYTKAN
jgi:hypothetical protein